MGFFGGSESEVLLPMQTRFRVTDIEKVWDAGSPPSRDIEFTLHPAQRDLLVKELEHKINQRVDATGFVDGAFRKQTERLVTALQWATVDDSGRFTVLLNDSTSHMTDIEHLRNVLRDMNATMRKNLDADPQGGMLTYPDQPDEFFTFASMFDEMERVWDEIDTVFVPDSGSTLNIRVENLGDEWIDPLNIEVAVKQMQVDGGGTFSTRDMGMYQGESGYAVATYKHPKTGETTFARVDPNDTSAIKAAIAEVREQFPDSPYVGMWLEGDVLHIGPTKVIMDRAEAFALAREKGQLALWDFDLGVDVPTPQRYNMTSAKAYTKASGKPRKHSVQAKSFKQATRKAGKKVDDLIDNEETTLYLDPYGTTGVAVGPDGQLVTTFEGITPLDEVLREVMEDGKVVHAVAPDEATRLTYEGAGFKTVAEVGDDVYMVRRDRIMPEMLDDWPVAVATPEEAYRLMYGKMGAEPPNTLWASRMADDFERWDGGLVRYIYDQEAEIAAFHPHLDPSLVDEIDLLSPAQAAKVRAIESELRRYKTGYTLKKMPEGGVPYWSAQGKDIELMFGGSRALDQLWYEKITSPASQVWDKLFSPVYSRELARLQQQHMYDEFLQYGGSVGETNTFIRAIRDAHEKMPTGPGGTHFLRRPDNLAPNTLNRIAEETLSPELLASIKAAGDDITDIVQRSGSRTFRYLSDTYPAKDGQKSLGGLIDSLYGKGDVGIWGGTTAAKAARRGTYLVKTAYHVFRFLMDPRWIAMNWFEADILALARAGYIGGRRARAQKMSTAARRGLAMQQKGKLSMQSVEDVLAWDQAASGWLDPRNLDGFIGEVFAIERADTTNKALIAALKRGDPVIDDLTSLFGDLEVNQWADELDRMLYDIDTKGARQMVLDEAAAQGMRYGENALFDEFLEGLWRQHQDQFRDITHIFHGNVNRMNIERFLNSPLLWWPLSYQLKAGKWVFDLLTDRFLGAKSDLLGAGYLTYAMQRHQQLMGSNDTYKGIFMDHPVLWRTLSMMLPMTPFDMGVFMARWTRYSGSWMGAQLGVWEQDPSYPQTLPDFLQRSTSLGPLFSIDLMEDLIDEVTGQVGTPDIQFKWE